MGISDAERLTADFFVGAGEMATQGSGNGAMTASSDALAIGVSGNTTTYNFENSNNCSFTYSANTMTLNGDCETTTTILVPDGFTLNGNGNSITAIDPAGSHFMGAVVKNQGIVASVTNLTVTTSGLADVCDAGDARLRGILLDGASGSITNNTVTGIRQAVASGCQEGNGIEVRNAPFSTVGVDKNITITGNIVSSYQKTGILANGSVAATITGNTITGDGPINYIAQNGIQIGDVQFGDQEGRERRSHPADLFGRNVWIARRSDVRQVLIAIMQDSQLRLVAVTDGAVSDTERDRS